MRYPALSLLLLPVATPALAHVESVVHLHSQDGAMWGVAIALAAVAAVWLLCKGV